METPPKFRIDLHVSEIQDEGYNGRVTLKDPVSDKFYQLSTFEYRLLKNLDGKITIEHVIELLGNDGYYYTKEDAQAIIDKAAHAGLLLGTRYGTAQFQSYLKNNILNARKGAGFSRLYFLFIPLVNPDRFLEKTLWIYRALVNKWTAALAAVMIPGAIYLMITRLSGVEKEYLFFFNWENLLYLWVTIAITKIVHELAHAYTAKSFGLRVPQMGVALLIFFPCLYCNTTDAWRLADRTQRLKISAAGIIAEFAVAIICTYIYFLTRPGILNSLSYYLVAVSLISTILFNANPLLKFDGYFILTDLLDKPNLASKAKSYILYLTMNRGMGITLFANPARSGRDAVIFSTYGASAGVYRIFLYTGIVAGVYYRFNKLLGLSLALIAFATFIIKPIGKGCKTLFKHRKEIRLKPEGAVALLATLVICVGVLTVPVSIKSVYPCYLEAAQIQKITVPLPVPVKTVLVRDREAVDAGQVMFQLDTTSLRKSLLQKQLEQDILKTRLKMLLLDDKNMSKALEQRIKIMQAQHEIDLLNQDIQMANKGIVAPFKGVITKLGPLLQEGFQTGSGAIVGELKSLTDCTVNILIPEKDIDDIEWGQEVKIWLPSQEPGVLFGRITHIKPFSESDLRGSPISSRYGGDIPTEAKDTHRQDSPLDAHYIATVPFKNYDSMPLLATGKCAVPSVRRSAISRVYNRVMQTFNRETLL